MLMRNNLNKKSPLNAQSLSDNVASVAECATFSLHVYGGENPMTLPPGWTLFDSYSSVNGYAGNCYVKDILTKNTRLVIASRGTVLSSPGDLITDIQVALNCVPMQLKAAQAFYLQIADKMAEAYQGHEDKLEFIRGMNTGHSLGAVLSDLCVVGTGATSITFENPGSKEILENYVDTMQLPAEQKKEILALAQESCFCYQADVNLINTYNEQIGRTFRLTNPTYDYYADKTGPATDIDSKFYLNVYYIFGYSLFDQHKIEKICQYLNAGGNTVETKYPNGMENGYVAYLDSSRKNYWDGYLELIWGKYPVIREQFNNDFDKYEKYFYEQLKLTKDKASSLATHPIHSFGLYAAKKPQDNLDIDSFVILNPTDDKSSNEPISYRSCAIL